MRYLEFFSRHLIRLVFVSLVLLTASGCSSTQNAEFQTKELASDPRDPLESLNRPFWTFTWDYADKYVAKPASQAYTEYTPEFVRGGLYNMATNLNEPSSAINNLLQGKFTDAAKNTGRFLLNSTIGLFGFFDLASDFEWSKTSSGTQEEFGEVLGSYGVGDGPYVVIPGLGPSSVREEVGDYVDKYYWPLAVLDFWPNLARNLVVGLEQRAALADQESLITESLDSYEFVKNGYFQNMKFKVYDGNPPVEIDEDEEAELDAYLDEFDEDEN